MKIVLNYGTQRHIPPDIICGIIESQEREADKVGLKISHCTVYLNYYNERGEPSDMLPDQSFIVRSSKYVKLPEDTEYVGRLDVGQTGNLYLYRVYE